MFLVICVVLLQSVQSNFTQLNEAFLPDDSDTIIQPPGDELVASTSFDDYSGSSGDGSGDASGQEEDQEGKYTKTNYSTTVVFPYE